MNAFIINVDIINGVIFIIGFLTLLIIIGYYAKGYNTYSHNANSKDEMNNRDVYQKYVYSSLLVLFILYTIYLIHNNVS
jgi:TRAP-type C4-dicarboxylate transport system permease small subunit